VRFGATTAINCFAAWLKSPLEGSRTAGLMAFGEYPQQLLANFAVQAAGLPRPTFSCGCEVAAES
jgi:hypothetical protein